jgi:OmpA-OmpF porin, OOP family
MASLRIRGVAAAVCVLAAATLTGCDSSSQGMTQQSVSLSCPTQPDNALTLVVGARANSPEPNLPAQVESMIHDAAVGGKEIQVIRVDGQPSLAMQATFATSGQNAQIRDRDLESFVSQTEQVVDSLQPKVAQADVLGALTMAAQITPDGGTVVLMDSGLPTTGPISFQDPGMFGADPTEVASFLKAQGLLPDLSGKSVVLVGLGNTADPQPALPPNIQAQIVTLWTTIADQGHAACVSKVQPGETRTSVSTSIPVAVVQPPAPPTFEACGSTVLGDDGSVGFIVNTATFREPAAARSALQSLATLLIGHPQTTVTLTGETSSEGSASANLVLSRNRAAAVKTVLVQLGVPAGQITTVGDGSSGPGHIVDKTSAGVLIPAAAEHNRAVVATLATPGC